MIYGIAEYHLRSALSTNKDSVPSQTNKPASKPTMKWVFKMFYNVQQLYIDHGGPQGISIVINVKERIKKLCDILAL